MRITVPSARHRHLLEEEASLSEPRMHGLLDAESIDIWDPTAHPLPGRFPIDTVEAMLYPDSVAPGPVAFLKPATALRFVQLQSAGFEHIVGSLPSSVKIANGRGVHSDETAEWALGMAIAMTRGLPDFFRNQARHRWRALPMRSYVAGSRVLVVGAGSIGRAVRDRFAACAADVDLAARHARVLADGTRVFALTQHIDRLGEYDTVVLAIPGGKATYHLVDGAFLTKMRRGALLVNVARGTVVDPDALYRSCSAGRISAALDVTDPEPLPPDSPLWDLENVLISPHVAGEESPYSERIAAGIFLGQLERLRHDEPLENLVS